MKKLLIALILIPIWGISFAQDWHPFPEGQTSYFATTYPEDHVMKYGKIKTIKIDSIVQEQSLQYYFNLCSPVGIDSDGEYSFWDPYSSWIGKYVIKHNYNPVVFTDRTGQEYQFNFISDETEPQLCSDIDDLGYLFVTLDSVKTGQVVEGIDDMMKFYSFKLYEGWLVNPIENSISEKQVIISQNYGLVQIFDFGKMEPIKFVNEKRIIGLDRNDETYGFNWDFDELITSYQIGSEYQLEQDESYYQYYLENKNTDEGVLTLNYSLCHGYESGSISSKTQEYYLGYYPGQTMIEDKKGYMSISLYKDETYGRRTWSLQNYKGFWEGYYNNQFVWINEVSVSNYGIVPHYEHANKAGVYTTFFNSNQPPYQLIYFKTEDETWGQSHDFLCGLGINEKYYSQLLVSPNPTAGIVNLSSSEKVEEVKIYSLNGQLVKTVNKIDDGTLDLSNLENGVYLLRILYQNQELSHQKMIINK